MKRILLLCFFTLSVIFNSYSATWTVNNNGDANTGAGTSGDLRWCIAQACNATGAQTINFAASYTITLTQNSQIAIYNNTQLLIDAGANTVIVRGNSNTVDGFQVNVNNTTGTVTILGLVFQNFNNAILVNGGCSALTIQKCKFGTDAAGTTKVNNGIAEAGIRISSGNVSNVLIGGPTLADGNLLSGCAIKNLGNTNAKYGAITLNNASTSVGTGIIIRNNIIGLDATGTSATNLGNGTSEPLNQHGIYSDGNISSTTRPLVIDQNIISNSAGNGVWINGGGSNGVVFTGNKIGTDITGDIPLGNKGAGIRIDGGNSHKIGLDAAGTVSASTRNIISGNGGAVDSRNCRANAWTTPACSPSPLTCGGNPCPDKYDGTLQCGIYLTSVNSSQIANNYIGTDHTGNVTSVPTTLSPYNGLGNLYAGVKIETNSTGNIIGGTSAAYANVIGGNGFDPFTPSGNDGAYVGHGIQLNISTVQSTTIRFNNVGVGADGVSAVGNRQDGISLLGSKNNTISNNNIQFNAWGIFLQSDFCCGTGSGQPTGNTISNNSLTKNGNRSTPVVDLDGGGIGLQHGSSSNTISSNTITGNGDGIALRFPDANNSSGPPSTNTISINTITNNDRNGIRLEGAQGNFFRTNIITGNKLDGISIAMGSINNIIGGTAAEGNTIASNLGNGIQIMNPNATGSTGNAINRNSISCNALRGIELNSLGNANFAKPTYTGTPTSFSVTHTGGASVWIELYTLDGCNDCGTSITNNKLQGKTLVAEGFVGSAAVTNINPATYGKTSNLDFTATASSAAPSTTLAATTAHNTSEFASCQQLCPTPTTAAAGSDIPVCAATTATLAGNTPTVGTGTWSVVSGTATITTPSSSTSGVTALAANGTATLRWSIISATGCTPSTDDVIITTNTTPTTAVAGTDIPVCAATTAALAGNAPTSGTGAWSVVSGAATITTASSRTSGVTGLAANGTATLRWTVSNGVCPSSTDDVIITTNTTPTTAAAGTDIPVCAATTATLAGNTPTTGSGAWSVVSGTATVTTTSVANSGVTGLAANGTATLRWTVTNGVCPASTDDVIITTNTTPTTAAAGTDIPVCAATTAALAGNAPTSGTGAWSVVSGAVTITTPSSRTSGVTGLAANGTATLRWTVSNGVCPSSTDDVIITTNTTPTTAAAGTDIPVCAATTATLAGNAPTTGTGAWSVLSGTATVTTTSAANSGVTGLAANGTATLRWTVSNGVCPSSTDDVIITTNTTPTPAAAGTDIPVCAGTTAALAGNAPTTGTGAWSVVSGAVTITTASSRTSGVTGLAANGTATLRWTVSNGVCPASTDDVIITTNTTPTTAAAGTDIPVCAGTTAALAGNAPTTGTGAWSVVSGAATITTASSRTSGVTGLAANGTATLRWTVSNGVCPSSTDDVIITTNTTPTTAAAGTDIPVCAATTATLAGNTPTTGTGAWSVLSGTASVTTTSAANSGVTGLAANGAATLRWTVSNGVCPSSTDDVIITTNTTPTTAAAGTDIPVCAATTAALAGNAPTSGTGAWSVVSGAVTITTPSSRTSGVTSLAANGTATLRWTVSNGVCPSSTDDVIITTNTNPTTAAAGSDAGICTTNGALSGNNPTTGTGTWTIVGTSTATIDNASQFNSGISSLPAGATTFRWTILNGVCPSSSDDVIITRDLNVILVSAGSDFPICGATTSTLSGNTPASGTGAWIVVGTSTATIDNPNQPSSGVSNLPAGATTFRWTITNGACPAATDDVIITRDEVPTTASAGGDNAVCSATGTLAGNAATIGSGTWTIIGSSTATIDNPSLANSGISDLPLGTTTFRWTIANGSCTSSTDDVIITRDEAPTTSVAGGDNSICTDAGTLSGNTSTSGLGTWTIIGTSTATIDNPTQSNSGISNLPLGATTFRWTIASGSCTESFDEVIITRDEVPTQAVATDINGGICSPTTTVVGNTPNVGVGTWSIAGGVSTASVDNPSTSTSTVSNLPVGITKFVWTVSNGSCTPSKDTVEVTRNVATPLSSIVTTDRTICGGGIDIEAISITTAGVTGKWHSIPSGLTFVDENDPTTNVSAFATGVTKVYWEVSGPCGVNADTLLVTLGVSNFIVEIVPHNLDTLCLGNKSAKQVTVKVNNSTATPYKYVWSSSDHSFDVTSNDNPVSITPVSPGWTFYEVYVVDNNNCVSNNTAKDSLYSIGQQALIIPNLMTPNDDKHNDCFLIRYESGFDILPGSVFNVYNRWGQAVYRNKEYKNGDFCGSVLADGIYYYHLEAGCGHKEEKGWLQIIGNADSSSNK